MRAPTHLLLALAVLLTSATAVQAQTDDPRIEFAVTGGMIGAVSFGSVDAELLRPSGAPLVIFSTENRLAPGYVLEAHIGQRVARRVLVEASGAWQRADFESRITDDVEDVDDVTLTERSSRFTVEGAVLIDVAGAGRWALFVRGGGGWMRELVGNGTLVEDGAVASLGAGMKYWWGDGGGTRLGLRLEGRASLRSAGITLGGSGWRVGPVVTGGLVFGF